MAITITDIGHNSNSAGATVALTVPAAGIAAGTLVCVTIAEATNSGSGSMTDSASNTYIRDNSGGSNISGQTRLYRSVIATGLTNGQTITYTKATSGHACGISGFSAVSDTGWPASPLDLHPAGTTSTSNAPSIASGTPVQANELFVAAVGWFASATFTQDSGNGWAAPFTPDTGQATASIAGGNQVVGTATGKTFAPSLGSSVVWAATLATYKPNPPSITWWGETQEQLPYYKSFRGAATMRGDDGNVAPFVNWQNSGWGVQSPQPPTRIRTPKPNLDTKFRGEDGTSAPFILWQNAGWEVQPPQPPHLRTESKGAPLRGDEGTQAPYIFWNNTGWEIQSVQPPHLRTECKGAPLRGDDGTQAPFVNWLNAGWEVQPPQPPHLQTERKGSPLRGDEGTQAPYIFWNNTGWEIQSVQPPHLRTEIKGAPLRGDDGTQAPFILWYNAGWEIQPPPPPHPRPEKSGAIAPWVNIDVPFVQWYNAGWEVTPPQPPHPHPERSGAVAIGELGIESPFIAVTAVTWGFEQLQTLYRCQSRALSVWEDGIEFSFILFQPYGWEVQPHQPPHFRPETRAASFLRGDEGIQTPYTLWKNAGWEVQPFQLPHPRPERFGTLVAGDQGNEATFAFTVVAITWGFDGPQPVLRRPAKAVTTWEDGIEYPFILFRPYGWEIPQPQPSHPHPERAGAIQPWSNIDAQFNQFQPYGWETVSTQPLHPRPARSGAVQPWINVDGQFILFSSYGWEVQPVQPPHRFVRIPAVLRGDDGTQAPYILWNNAGWEVQPFQPPHLRTEIKGASFPRGDEGIQAQLIKFQSYGWEIQPPQLPHPRPESRGLYLRGDEGVQYSIIVWYNAGWEIQAWQPPHPRPEKAGAILPYASILFPTVFHLPALRAKSVVKPPFVLTMVDAMSSQTKIKVIWSKTKLN